VKSTAYHRPSYPNLLLPVNPSRFRPPPLPSPPPTRPVLAPSVLPLPGHFQAGCPPPSRAPPARHGLASIPPPSSPGRRDRAATFFQALAASVGGRSQGGDRREISGRRSRGGDLGEEISGRRSEGDLREEIRAIRHWVLPSPSSWKRY
jgi:hypothetical protein